MDEAKAAGLEAHIVSTTLEGEAREVGRTVAELAREPPAPALAAPCLLVGCGREATVSLAMVARLAPAARIRRPLWPPR